MYIHIVVVWTIYVHIVAVLIMTIHVQTYCSSIYHAWYIHIAAVLTIHVHTFCSSIDHACSYMSLLHILLVLDFLCFSACSSVSRACCTDITFSICIPEHMATWAGFLTSWYLWGQFFEAPGYKATQGATTVRTRSKYRAAWYGCMWGGSFFKPCAPLHCQPMRNTTILV